MVVGKRADRKPIQKKEYKSDREEEEDPKAEPKPRSIIVESVSDFIFDEVGPRKEEDQGDGEEENDPKDQPE